MFVFSRRISPFLAKAWDLWHASVPYQVSDCGRCRPLHCQIHRWLWNHCWDHQVDSKKLVCPSLSHIKLWLASLCDIICHPQALVKSVPQGGIYSDSQKYRDKISNNEKYNLYCQILLYRPWPQKLKTVVKVSFSQISSGGMELELAVTLSI